MRGEKEVRGGDGRDEGEGEVRGDGGEGEGWSGRRQSQGGHVQSSKQLQRVIQHCINEQLPSNIVPNVTDTSCLPVDVE